MKKQENIQLQKHNYGYLCQPSNFALQYLIYPLGIGQISNEPDFTLSRNYFPGYLVMYCLSGKLHLLQYDISTTLLPGQSCLLSLGDYHKYYSDQNDPCDILWIHFDGKSISDLIFRIFEQHQKYVIIKDNRIGQIIKNCISQIITTSTYSESIISVNLYQIIIFFLENTLSFCIHEGPSPLEKQINKYINDHLDEKITLEILANQCHLNPSYFCRRFHAETNMTPIKYVMNKKIEQSKYYLLYTNYSISVIAQKLGFYDQNHFSFCFSKEIGCSPSSFRKQNKSTPQA